MIRNTTTRARAAAKIEILPVIFRIRGGEVTAVFPTLPADGRNHFMTCYAHIGQHGSCSLEWYRETRRAKPAEYADLFEELRGIYEQGDDPYELRVYQRITPQHRAAFLRNG